MKNQIVFGPILSRRLGWSLGVDLVPYKTCSLDCVYCESGKTTDLTVNFLKNPFTPSEVFEEISKAIKNAKHLDYITFSGGGEPTLYKYLDEIIIEIKKTFPDKKIALITNSTMFTKEEVFQAALKCDLVLPSVDSVTQEGFEAVNRPHIDLKLDDILSSLLRFRESYKGQLWVEYFVIKGLNDSDHELVALSKYFSKLKPDSLQINTLDRPGTESWVKPITMKELDRIKSYFNGLPVEVISRKLCEQTIKSGQTDFATVLDSMLRRPLTTDDIINITGKKKEQVIEWLNSQLNKGLIEKSDTHWICRKQD